MQGRELLEMHSRFTNSSATPAATAAGLLAFTRGSGVAQVTMLQVNSSMQGHAAKLSEISGMLVGFQFQPDQPAYATMTN